MWSYYQHQVNKERFRLTLCQQKNKYSTNGSSSLTIKYDCQCAYGDCKYIIFKVFKPTNGVKVCEISVDITGQAGMNIVFSKC